MGTAWAGGNLAPRAGAESTRVAKDAGSQAAPIAGSTHSSQCQEWQDCGYRGAGRSWAGLRAAVPSASRPWAVWVTHPSPRGGAARPGLC